MREKHILLVRHPVEIHSHAGEIKCDLARPLRILNHRSCY